MFLVWQALWSVPSLWVHAWKAIKSADAAQHSPASLGSQWSDAAVLSSLCGSLATCLLLCLVPLPATQSLCFKNTTGKFVDVPKLKPQEMVALWPGVLRLCFNGSNKRIHSNFQEAGDQTVGKRHKKVSEVLCRMPEQLFGEGDTLFPKNCFVLNPWKFTGNRLGRNHRKL